MANIENIERVAVDELIPYAFNSKKHPEKQIAKIADSIQEFGFISPVLIDKDKNIIAGHGRVNAAKKIGLEQIPCVRVEGLTDAQKKAYIIADNRLTELGGWDRDIVKSELSLLDSIDFNIDMTGFSVDYIWESLQDGKYGDERKRTAKAYNIDVLGDIPLGNDYWQMPVIAKQDIKPTKLIGFNYAKTSSDKEAGIHFFIDDYQFERVWKYPDKYIDILKQYECVISPEFSLYIGMPLPMKIWNTYRNRFIGAYFQSKGINVIPSICFTDKNCFDFCFLGVEEGSTVAVETNGIKLDSELTDMWITGMREMINRIKPKTILAYGSKIDFDYGDIEVIYYENQVTKRWKGEN